MSYVYSMQTSWQSWKKTFHRYEDWEAEKLRSEPNDSQL